MSTIWDEAADEFDDQPDHGLRAPRVRAAWAACLARWIPPGSDVLDVGCGTGSLTALLLEAGHRVTGIDSSPRMIAKARAKVGDRAQRGDATDLPDVQIDVILARHLVWTLPPTVLEHWTTRLRPGGRLVLVEGRWHTGAGIPADTLRQLVPLPTTVEPLTDPDLWGGPIDDERYCLIARKAATVPPASGRW